MTAQGFRWFSIDEQLGSRELWRATAGLVTVYEAYDEATVAADQPGSVEAVYVVDGLVDDTYGPGDLVFHRGGGLRFTAGTRVVRFAWTGEASGQTLHVFGDQGPVTRYHDAPVTVRVAAQATDGRAIVFHGTLPEGVTFREEPGDLEETFLMIAGEIRCTPDGGTPISWTAGDLVYWPYDRPLQMEYSVGMACICCFWSPDPLPDFTGADATIKPQRRP